MRIGLFGGTFDPLHNGHLGAIKALDKELEFDQINWVLSARPPHKDSVSASIEHRFEMLRLGLKAHPNYVVDDTEIRRSEKSYTVDTIMEFKQARPSAELVLIIGTDSLLKLHTWHRAEELVEMVNIVVMSRPGYQPEVPAFVRKRMLEDIQQLGSSSCGRLVLFSNAEFDISSTGIRQMLYSESSETQQKAAQYLPPDVYSYILRQQLYRTKIMNPKQIKDLVVEALEDVKGVDIKVIDIADISDFADFMVVASGTSDTHVKALARSASDRLRKAGVKPLNEDGADIGEWILVDLGDVVLHVMRPEVREYYDLEKLWDEDVRNMLKVHRESQAGDGEQP